MDDVLVEIQDQFTDRHQTLRIPFGFSQINFMNIQE